MPNPQRPPETALGDVRLAHTWRADERFGAVPGQHRAACFGRPPGLGAERGRLLEKRVGLGERGGGLELLEDVAGLAEGLGGLGQVAEFDEATALAEEGERLLRDDTERLPAPGGVGVPRRSCVVVTVGFGEGGVH